ncbi:FkbM family methyltransferase [Candidatus Kaiserbacteria bacterium]|nr:FkbM family methyltransferase [Candidatus Kaiserbacteria bacterium]
MLNLEMLIKEELLPLRLPSFVEKTHEQHIAWRAYGFGAWRRGEVSLLECVENLMPGRFKSPELQHKLQALLDRELEGIFERAGLYQEVPTLFEKPFIATSPQRFKNWLVALRLINEVILQDEYRARGRITEDSIVIDAGANIGTFSVFAATLASRGKIYAFEPARSTFDTLEKNLGTYANAVAVQSALGDRLGETELLIENSSGEGNTLTESGMSGSYSGKEEVPITTIDAFVHGQKLSGVDFIKVDSEGFEKQILEGATETIKKYRPALSLSAYHKQGDPARLTALISSYSPHYRFELKSSPELDLICDAR